MLSALSERYSQNVSQTDSLTSAAALLKSQKYYEAWQQCYNNSNSSMSSSSNPSQESSLNRSMQDKSKALSLSMLKKEKKPFLDQNIRKKEFDQLSKARTDKLLSDGPNQVRMVEYVIVLIHSKVPPKVASPVKQQPPSNPQIKLIQLIMDEKKRSLFKSSAVKGVLQKRQKAIEIYKRRTELFSVTMMAQHQAVLNIQRQQQQLASPQTEHSFSHKRTSQI
ncbi:hypothetical protein Ciccas_003241 [Cichlidogyrus casuarinus]|uniref:Uncharacterized protein n=1 Tax=Cichlidogyrus casuarinus TaxID=1844966 RepID=A0ABD2QH80_9PLAT